MKFSSQEGYVQIDGDELAIHVAKKLEVCQFNKDIVVAHMMNVAYNEEKLLAAQKEAEKSLLNYILEEMDKDLKTVMGYTRPLKYSTVREERKFFFFTKSVPVKEERPDFEKIKGFLVEINEIWKDLPYANSYSDLEDKAKVFIQRVTEAQFRKYKELSKKKVNSQIFFPYGERKIQAQYFDWDDYNYYIKYRLGPDTCFEELEKYSKLVGNVYLPVDVYNFIMNEDFS